MDIIKIISERIGKEEKYIKNAIDLLDDGDTVAFISRYRKEKTDSMSDVEIRNLQKELTSLRNLEKRQKEVITSIEKQSKLTEELKEKILNSTSITEVEDLYKPYKKRKETRADKARNFGLEELNSFILNEDPFFKDVLIKAKEFLNDDLKTEEEIINMSRDILAEDISNDIEVKNIIRLDGFKRGILSVTKKDDENKKYENYYDLTSKIRNLKSFQILAIFRGESEGALNVKFNFSDEYNLGEIKSKYKKYDNYAKDYVNAAVEDSYKRLLINSIENEIRNSFIQKAQDESIVVFAKNLKPYLLQRPIKNKRIIGLDPGYRTGCKVAVIDENGKYLDKAVIYPAKPKEDIEGSIEILNNLIKKYSVDVIALGNGTASRETELMVDELIKRNDKNLSYAIVNEAGASIYSASKIGQEEFPDLDVTIRGAISMARRLQDPMAELVKIEPQHLGIGQYQHDIDKKKLNEELRKVVEDSVNEVGVTINNASYVLLSYVSGLSLPLAKRIEEAQKDGKLKRREDLKNIKGLGQKTYDMAAGFIRFPDSDNFLDNTAVHPESYDIALKIKDENLEKIDYEKISEKLNIGIPTLKDIVNELKKPGRDPREEALDVITKKEVMTVDDLKEGMWVKGVVRNVVDFGIFVDIGVHIDGLVHISQISDKYVKNPSDVVKVSDIIDVKILEIDKEKERIALSMK
ncbi:MAG: Tex family protein [Peptoniphilaceae bacterium]|nr:RNA-binding transcriptional accessory protein [Peptoniphilaceae bacterium]MDD7383385.1 Tex family protein [Peptoniphilaceae bacterium]MDY3738244.1 Tex family protein [Peptoniphilaceae bacterium]